MNRPVDLPGRVMARIPENNSLQDYKLFLSSIEDPVEREIAETAFSFGHAVGAPARQQVIVLLHGIRTEAIWQEVLAEEFRDHWNLETFPIGYGVLDVLRFLCPIWTRKGSVERVTLELRNVRRKFPNADVSVIAHSFGTYVLSKILEEHTDIAFHRIQLCGAVIPERYRWDKVISRISGQIVNDVGTKDIWPLLAKSSTWGFGESGLLGFKTIDVRDRFFEYGHSDFLTVSHARKFWIPLLLDGQIVRSPFTKKRKASGFLVGVLRFLPLKYSVPALFALLFVAVRFGWFGWIFQQVITAASFVSDLILGALQMLLLR